MVLEATAKDAEGKVLFQDQKTYFEIGVDTEGDMRYGAWQIKEIIDLTLKPMERRQEKFLMHFTTETEEVEVEVKLLYYIKGSKGDVIYSVKKQLEFEID